MRTLFDQFSQVFGVTLLHSLWQGLVVYVLLRLILLCIPTASSANKCNVALLALAASVLWPLGTLLVELANHPITGHIAATGNNNQLLPLVPAVYTAPATPAAVIADTWSLNYSSFLPYLVTLWLVGIVINSVRLLLGWRNLYRIKQSVVASPVLQNSIQKLSHLLKVKRQVGVFLSEHIDVPCIVAYLKPMIILPVAVVSQFTVEQVQSILIHEMAHIRRNDYFINLLQQAIAILFFFNPFTHLINRIIYSEREHSCDDLVLQITGQPLIYAQTLLQLEQTRGTEWQLAMAATGKKHYLLNRIKRIMETKKQVNNIRHILMAVLLLLGSMGTIAWLNPEIKNGKVRVSPVNVADLMFQADDTTKAAKAKTKGTSKTKTSTQKSKGVGSSYGYGNSFSDEQLEKLSAAAEKYGKEVSKYYESEDFKKLTRDMEKQGAAMEAAYNNPDMEKMQKRMEQIGRDFEEDPQMKAMTAKMTLTGKKIEAYYASPEFKQMDARLKKKHGVSADGKYDDHNANYKSYQDELKRNIPADITSQTEELTKMGLQISGRYSSPEFTAQRDQLTAMADSMGKAYSGPMIKQQQEQMMKMSQQILAYQSSPELKKLQQQLLDAVKKMTAYQNSPEFKKHIEKMQKEAMKEYYKAEKPERPEKPEKPEKAEKPEKPEKPEQPEKPEAPVKPEVPVKN